MQLSVSQLLSNFYDFLGKKNSHLDNIWHFFRVIRKNKIVKARRYLQELSCRATSALPYLQMKSKTC